MSDSLSSYQSEVELTRELRPLLSADMSYSNRTYKFRFRAHRTTETMSQDGTKRIQPKRQTLDDAYSPPGEASISTYYQALKLEIFSANFLEIIVSDAITHGDNRKDLFHIFLTWL